MENFLAAIREFNIWTVVLRLTLAFIFGGCVGIERERRGRTAGLRTHILVALGACLTILSGLFVSSVLNFSSDPLRIGAQVISGIGFLGAGTIMVTRQTHIKGLTTAAGLWTTAAIGLSLGCGFYEGAVACLVLAMVAISLLDNLERRIKGGKSSTSVTVYIEISGLQNVNEVIKTLKHLDIEIFVSEIEEAKSRNTSNIGMRLEMRYPRALTKAQAFDTLSSVPNVLFAAELNG